jgi:hypothetical protein
MIKAPAVPTGDIYPLPGKGVRIRQQVAGGPSLSADPLPASPKSKSRFRRRVIGPTASTHRGCDPARGQGFESAGKRQVAPPSPQVVILTNPSPYGGGFLFIKAIVFYLLTKVDGQVSRVDRDICPEHPWILY